MSAVDALHTRWSLDAGEHEHVVFLVEGMRCAGCAHTIEKAARSLPGVEAVRVNGANARVSVDWRGGGATGLSQILEAISRAGFTPVPLAGSEASTHYARERRAALKRVGLASLGMMQAMMYLGALYGVSDIDAAMSRLMAVSGMVIVTPILFYSGAPFLVGAWRDLQQRRVGMDVPVALALLLAWLPSVVNTFRGAGELYFDSVAMFIFFLSAGRFLEMSVRHRGATTAEALARSLPARVTRLSPDGSRHDVTAAELAPGDRFLVPKGAVIAVDARLAPDALAGTVALLDESLLTGESTPVRRGAEQLIRGGSLNIGAALTLVAVTAAGDSTLAAIVTLQERARDERPRLARAADRAASWFVAVILVLALITGALWWSIDPTRAFPAVLAVLVVTCPCALSLATPAALAAATTRLSRLGILVTRADAIERLAGVDTVVMDKTGTLTIPATGIVDVKLLGALPREVVLTMAAALERGSQHPLAAAFRALEDPRVQAASIREVEGSGIEGFVAGQRWRLGTRDFVSPGSLAVDDATLYLGNDTGLVAAMTLGTPLRAGAPGAIQALRAEGLSVIIASGDADPAVQLAASTLGITRALSRLSPQEKIRLLEELRADGRHVFAIGDGINDGPVLAAAQVSCAMGEGSAIAQSAADMLLVHEDLSVLPRAVVTARRALRVMRQNLGWSLAYNLAAVPAAALGLVPPWLAALGMSLSSLAVVFNARRLATPGAGA